MNINDKIRIRLDAKGEVVLSKSIGIGNLVRHETGRVVLITDGSEYRNGRCSNFWYWVEVKKDLSFGGLECGYGWL